MVHRVQNERHNSLTRKETALPFRRRPRGDTDYSGSTSAHLHLRKPIMSTTIAPIGTADLPRVQALAHEIWPEAFAGILPEDRIPGMLAEIYALETLAADIAERGHQYWLASGEAGDLGFASAYRAEGRVWIKKLYVHEMARGLGLGKQLIAVARAHFGSGLPVALYVNDGNAPAIAFYKAQGFTIEKHVPVQMGPYQFTDYVMVKQ